MTLLLLSLLKGSLLLTCIPRSVGGIRSVSPTGSHYCLFLAQIATAYAMFQGLQGARAPGTYEMEISVKIAKIECMCEEGEWRANWLPLMIGEFFWFCSGLNFAWVERK